MNLNQHKEAITKRTIARFSDLKSPQLALGAFFPSKVTTEKMVSVEVMRGRRRIAVDIQRGTGGRLNTFDRYTEKLYVPPYFEEKFNMVDLDVYNVTFGQNTNPSTDQAIRLIETASDKLQILKDKIELSKELQRSQAVQTGIVTMNNGDNIDFGRKAASIVDLGTGNYWDDANVNPLPDIEEGIKFVRQEGKSTSRRFNLILGGEAYTALRNNEQFQKLADIRNYTIITLGNNVFDDRTGMNYQASIQLRNGQVDIWTYDEFYESSDDVYTEFIDQKNAVLIPADFVGLTSHAGVPAILRDKANAEFSNWIIQTASEYSVNNHIDENAMAHWFKLYSAPLAIPVSIDRVFTMQVLD